MSDLPVPIGPAGAPCTVLAEALGAAVGYIDASKAASTRKAYAVGWAHFTAWCEKAGVSSLPALPASMAAYLSAMAAEDYAFATIEQRRAAVTHYHKTAVPPHASPSSDPWVEATIAGIKRTIGTRQAQKAPATDVELRAMLKRMSTTLAGLRDRAILTCGYAGALRRSEIVSIDVSMIERVSGGLILHLGKTKANQEGADEIVGIPHGRLLKPVAALDAWLVAAGITVGPVFRPIDRHGRVLPRRLTGQSVGLIVKRHCGPAGLDPGLFAGHSLRAGLVTAALGSGADLFAVMDAARQADPRTTKKYDRRAKVIANHAGRKVI